MGRHIDSFWRFQLVLFLCLKLFVLNRSPMFQSQVHSVCLKVGHCIQIGIAQTEGRCPLPVCRIFELTGCFIRHPPKPSKQVNMVNISKQYTLGVAKTL